MYSYFQNNIASRAHDPVIVQAIIAQNAQTSQNDQAKIDEMDALWRAFVGVANADIIAGAVTNPAAGFLRDQVAQSGGAITEIFAMDSRGLKVAASQPTSDYWQGDEAKFTQTYPMEAAAIHFGDIEVDHQRKKYRGRYP